MPTRKGSHATVHSSLDAFLEPAVSALHGKWTGAPEAAKRTWRGVKKLRQLSQTQLIAHGLQAIFVQKFARPQ